MEYIVIILFVIVHICAGNELGYSSSSPIWTHATYQFQHLNWIHLLLNSFTFLSLCKILRKALPLSLILVYAYFTSVIISFFSELDLPTVGASGMIYAMSGMFISISLIGEKLRIVDYSKFSLFLFGITIALVLSAIKPHINFFCHLLGLCLGSSIGILDNWLNHEKHSRRN
ncbi:rhomboid family intramembrane serine protease [Parabacteroides provencensis]|uniref:rhomboid family intramembrane serine protease n=1 Tax=Parabacteroides provencensis TaxID=1944636 RepID=UPI000C15CE06|nr:rhomboid family intramembrane serine protease [Parabacteroides provencensis]